MSLKWSLALASASALALSSLPSRAALMSEGVAPPAPAVEQAQFGPLGFLFGGHNYCFYDGGWHGPGWYWCGYAYRTGYGYGGPDGWRGRYHGGGHGYHGGGMHMGGGHMGGGMHMGGGHMGGGMHMGSGHMGGMHMGGMHMGGGHMGGGGMHMGGGGGHGGGGHGGGGGAKP